jgi:hypothetical protein
MPSRSDVERLVAWCDAEAPFGWTKRVIGAALAVHTVSAIGEPAPPAAALCAGDIALKGVPGISELPAQSVRFAGALAGVRNPARELQLTLEASAAEIVAKISGRGMPPAWGSGLAVDDVRDESGLISVDWTLATEAADGSSAAGGEHPLLFELLLWPALRKSVDLGPP